MHSSLSLPYKEFSHIHNVVDRGVLQTMWEELAGKVVHRDLPTTPI